MRKEKHTIDTEEEWEKLSENHAEADYGDPLVTLKSLDRYLQKQGKEVVIIEAEGSGCLFKIESMEGEVTLTAAEANLVKLLLEPIDIKNSEHTAGLRGLMKKVK